MKVTAEGEKIFSRAVEPNRGKKKEYFSLCCFNLYWNY